MYTRAWSILFLGVALLPGCGRDAPLLTHYEVPPILTPLPGQAFTVPPGGGTRIDFDATEAGTILATLDWTDPANNVVAAFSGRGCHSVNDALAGRCNDAEVYDLSSTCASKPRTLSVVVWRPVALRLWIANTGASAESGVVELTHCKDAPDCAAGLSCGQCIWVAWERDSCR